MLITQIDRTICCTTSGGRIRVRGAITKYVVQFGKRRRFNWKYVLIMTLAASP